VILHLDPTPDELEILIAGSKDRAARWITINGSTVAWDASQSNHAGITNIFNLQRDEYDKGIFTVD